MVPSDRHTSCGWKMPRRTTTRRKESSDSHYLHCRYCLEVVHSGCRSWVCRDGTGVASGGQEVEGQHTDSQVAVAAGATRATDRCHCGGMNSTKTAYSVHGDTSHRCSDTSGHEATSSCCLPSFDERVVQQAACEASVDTVDAAHHRHMMADHRHYHHCRHWVAMMMTTTSCCSS